MRSRMSVLLTRFLSLIVLGLVMSCSGGESGDGNSSGNGAILDSYGTISTWSGVPGSGGTSGIQGFNGDGLNRTETWHNLPMEMDVAPDGTIYLIDWNNFRIRKLMPDETWQTIIGTDTAGDWPCQNPDDPADCEMPLTGTMTGMELNLNHWLDLAFRPDSNSFGYSIDFAAWHNHKVTHYDPSMTTDNVTVISGNGKRGFDIKDDMGNVITDGDAPQPAQPALMDFPSSVAVDTDGNLFVAAERSNRVRRIAPDTDRTVTTVAGSSEPATTVGYSGDGGPATQALLGLSAYTEDTGGDNPEPGGSLVFDTAGNLYIADTYNHCIRKVTPGTDGVIGDDDPLEEIITRFAGICGENEHGYVDGPVLDARFYHPRDLDFGPDGRLYVTDTDNSVIRAIDLTTGTIVTVAGNGSIGFSGDGGPATEAKLRNPYGSAFDQAGNLYIVDTKNNLIRIVTP